MRVSFREIVRAFLRGDAVRVVSSEQLTEVVLNLLRSPQDAMQLGARAKWVVEGGRGSTERTLSALREFLGRHVAPRAQLSLPPA